MLLSTDTSEPHLPIKIKCQQYTSSSSPVQKQTQHIDRMHEIIIAEVAGWRCSSLWFFSPPTMISASHSTAFVPANILQFHRCESDARLINLLQFPNGVMEKIWHLPGSNSEEHMDIPSHWKIWRSNSRRKQIVGATPMVAPMAVHRRLGKRLQRIVNRWSATSVGHINHAVIRPENNMARMMWSMRLETESCAAL